MGIHRDGVIRWRKLTKRDPNAINSFMKWLEYKSLSKPLSQFLTETNLAKLPIEISEGLIRRYFEDSDLFMVDDWTPGGKFSCQVLVKTVTGKMVPQYSTRRLKSRNAAMVDAFEWCFDYVERSLKWSNVDAITFNIEHEPHDDEVSDDRQE